MPGRRRILILAGDTNGNLGDRGLVGATCEAIRSFAPETTIALAASKGEEDAAYFHAETFSRGLAGFRGLLAQARRADIVLVGGGGLFQDDDSLIKMPYWAARIAVVRLCCPRIVGFSLGVGPLRSVSGRLSARLAFSLMESVSVRDPEAQVTAAPLSSKEVQIVPDPAMLLEPVSSSDAETFLQENGVPIDGRPLIGVAARRWFYRRGGLIPHKLRVRLGLTPASGIPENARFIDLLVRVLSSIVREHGAHVVVMPSYAAAHEGDREICGEIQRRMPDKTASFLSVDDPQLYKGVAGRLSVFVGGRMHPAIFAASAGTPVVGLAYNQKFNGFFALLGQSDRVMALEEFASRGLTEQLEQLIVAALEERDAPRERIEQLQEQTRSFVRQLCIA